MDHHLRLRFLLPALAIACRSGATSTAPMEPRTATAGSPEAGSPATGPAAPEASETFNIDVCTGKEYRVLDEVRADPAIDFFELREEIDTARPNVAPRALATAGTPCAKGNAQKCQQDLQTLRSPGWSQPGPQAGFQVRSHRYLVATSGDTITTITSLDALREFVMPIDNAKDAALLATAPGEYRFECDGTKNARRTSGGIWELRVISGHGCGAGNDVKGHVAHVSANGRVSITDTTVVKKGNPSCAIGRRPSGLEAPCEARGDAVGRYFAEAAYLEAASVVAFERLAGELADLGAPRELVDEALVSRDDEVRHARMTAATAKRFGAETRTPVVNPAAKRSAREIALENATEGCVRETYGALLAHHQASAAADRSIACMMQSIAEDETRHAGLAWNVAAWLEPQLPAEDRAEIAAARARAVRELREELASGSAAMPEAGLPDVAHAVALLDALSDTLFQA